MVEVDVVYEAELHCSATHAPSGRTLETDAPVDNHGRGESFSPTDLVAAALGTCILTVMGIRARKEGWNLAGTAVRVRKHMSAELPRRIARLEVDFAVPAAVASALPPEARRALEHVADTCPVRLSIHPQIEVPVQFDW